MQSDTRGWHRASNFVVDHAKYCGRPVYVRTLTLWHPGLDSFLSNTRLGRWLFWAFPTLFAGRTLLCVTCDTMEFQSRLASWIFQKIEDIREGEDPHVFYFFDDDMEMLTPEQQDHLQKP